MLLANLLQRLGSVDSPLSPSRSWGHCQTASLGAAIDALPTPQLDFQVGSCYSLGVTSSTFWMCAGVRTVILLATFLRAVTRSVGVCLYGYVAGCGDWGCEQVDRWQCSN